MKLLDKIKKIIEEEKYLKQREAYLKRLTHNIGTIKEDDDKITVYVNQELLDRNAKNVFYDLGLMGMNTHYEKSKRVVDYFKLNKPVYYIFDGITFNVPTKVSGYFCNIVFKNCTFYNGMRIFSADNIVLENNNYVCYWEDFKDRGNAFIYGSVDELTIKNENFVNSDDLKKYYPREFGINLEAKKLNVENSTLSAESNGTIVIRAEETNIKDSLIDGPEVYIESKSFKTNNSILSSDKGIVIENAQSDYDANELANNVCAPVVLYNGQDITEIQREILEIKKSRQELINSLAKVYNKCEQVSHSLIEDKSIQEVLKK